jgi:site-specific DNA-methyltransferase (adenine-specific)
VLEINAVYHLEALSLLGKLDEGSVHAVITDPPYCSGGFSETAKRQARGQGLRSETVRRVGWFINDNMSTAGLVWLLRETAVDTYRVIAEGGSLLMFTDWRMVSHLSPAIESAGFRYQNLIVWDKGSAGLGTGFRPQHELIMHFVKGSAKFHRLDGRNVIYAKRVNTNEREHQTEKPVDLLQELVTVVTQEGDLVVDPFCGSGSTLVAAKREKRNYIGGDMLLGNVEIARNRLADPESLPLFNQPQLFGEVQP